MSDSMEKLLFEIELRQKKAKELEQQLQRAYDDLTRLKQACHRLTAPISRKEKQAKT